MTSTPQTRQDCQALDRLDPLAEIRARFALPDGVIYLDGHSLGPATHGALERLARAAGEEWRDGLIRSWNTAGWFDLPVRTGAKLARLAGVAPGEAHLLTAADRDRLLQVLLNLLSNALKFVPAGHGRVIVRLTTDARAATIEVSDNGPGIAPEQQPQVFEKFRQGGEANNRPQGTGLGLPISRQIVEHFGGRIWLQSRPGQGACFGFDLPWHPEEKHA